MIREQLDNLIKESMLSHDSDRVRVLRMIKSEILLYQTSKNSKPIDDSIELSIIKKMIKQRTDGKEQYIKGNRLDLVDSETKEINILNEFLPQEASMDDIKIVVSKLIEANGWNDGRIPKKSMGVIIKSAKEMLSNVDNKILADYIKSLCV